MSKTEAKAATPTQEKEIAKTGNFVRENQKSLLFIAIAIVAIVAIYFIYQKMYLGPREIEAADQMHVAQDNWEKKDWDKAIKGDAGFPGFEKIVADYGNTKAANLAYFYLGTAYLNKGEFQKAVDAFTNYHGEDSMVAAEALGGTGDAYVELKDYDKAASYFQKAADKGANKFLTPFYLKKLGLVYEAKNDYKTAADTYKQIKSDYPESVEAQSIDEYIARAEAKQN
ncbi:cytochrome c-type biogenesis protein CcmH/NrfG [Mucilaginibacter yixingensis]|uniref:Cytochrome c-type biogenesis protein CcmH/NrfG n=1 Tax=Mucilaginibacter yixingensis TaxID=1295612 RepID=A0A2T5J4T6_9SPHI|nr:tetratricopeptide repeat protein [Mucilaginibacter yixingensis]PTQ92680.1 cytochrome c-type biogenesis protein CcmH/NrfG [Mucilaginibacter yixingensis]